MQGLRDLVTALGYWGPIGAFVVAFVDSAAVPMLNVVDVLIVARAAGGDPDAWIFAGAATIGSVAGTLVLLRLAQQGRKAPGLRSVSPQRLDRLRRRLERYPTLAILPPAAIPVPFPMKALIVSAGILKLSPWRVGALMAVGRAIRYFGLTWLGQRYGEMILGLIREYAWPIVWGVVAAIALAVWYFWRRRSKLADQRL